MASGIFRPRRRPIQPRRKLLPAKEGPRPVSGVLVVGAIGRGAAAKRTSQAGRSTACTASTSISVKVAPVVGDVNTGAVGAAVNQKVAVETAPATFGAVGHGGALEKTVSQSGFSAAIALAHGKSIPASPVVAFLIGTATDITKIVTSTGVGADGLTTAGQAVKRVSLGGRCTVGWSSHGQAAKVVEAEGRSTLLVSDQGTFAAGQAGVTAEVVVGTGQPTKIAWPSGVCTLGLGDRGRMARRVSVSGISLLATTPVGTSRSKVASVTGQLRMGVTTTGYAVVVGPTVGVRISPPKPLPEEPIAGSVVTWSATVPPGASVLVETSVDNGATWQQATNGGPVPRLLPGTTVAKAVMSRVTLTRRNAVDPSPRVHRLEIRVEVDSSRDELVPLGRFMLNEVAIQDSPNGLEVEISGADLARKVARNKWDRTYVLYEGTNYAEAIKAVVRNRFPGVTFNFVSTNKTTPRLFFGEQSENDPWEDARDMAELIGCELYFDPLGVCTMRPEPDPELSLSVWELEDTSHPTITQLVRRITDEDTYNKVIVTGEGSYNTVPVRGEAVDADPSSPTYVLGPYGVVTKRVTSPMVLTNEQAQAAAEGLLKRVKGATEAVEIEAVPMPALEPGDVITVTRGRSKVEGRFIIDQMRMPLGADEPMRLVCRRQRI